MVKRFSDTEIWKKDWFLDLTDKQKLLVKFLFDNCDCAGIYEISQRFLRASFEQPITKEDFKAIKQVRFIDEKTIFIEDFIRFQYKVEPLELNPKFTVHRGILSRLNKYGLFETLTQPLPNPLLRVQDKDKDKDINNTISKQIDTIDNNKKNSKKIDPYINPTKTFFIKEYEKIFNKRPFLYSQDCNRLCELAADYEDIEELIPQALEKLSKIKFEGIDFKPSASWLLKDNNFERVMNGEFDNSIKEETDGWSL